MPFLAWSNELHVAAPAVAAQLLARFTSVPNAPLLLDVGPGALRQFEWEDLTRTYPFSYMWPGMGWGAAYRPVMRYSPRPADMALVALKMPVDVLVVQFEGWAGSLGGVLPDPLKHFRTVHASRVDPGSAAALAASSPFDILHLRLPKEPAAAPSAGAVTSTSGPPVVTRRGRRAPRLVVIESDAVGLAAAKELGHRYHAIGRPTVIVVDCAAFQFDWFYEDLTHDWALADAFLHASQNHRNMFLIAKGGDELLSLRRAEQVLRRRVQDEQLRIRQSLESLKQWQAIAPSSAVAQQAESSFHSVESMLADFDAVTFGYSAESEGMEPLTRVTGQLEEGLATAPSRQAVNPRVVNTWFTEDGRDVPSTRSLRAGGRYTLLVAVGIPTPRSIVPQPVSLHEEDLAPFYQDGGVPLRVILFSSDFDLEHAEQTLMLPRPPAGSEPVAFPVTAPVTAGQSRLRVAVYHDNNLLQSIMITAAVADAESDDIGGQQGVVEWALSASLSDLDRFGRKAVSLLTNQGPGGTHLLAVVGDDFREQLEMDAGTLNRKVDEARNTLQWVCGDPGKKEKYRFEPHNRSTGADFREHMSGMAEFGYDLYTSLVINHADVFEQKLQNALAHPTVIQAARMRSSKSVFPWALVYDLPFVLDRRNEVCPEFLELLKAGASADDLTQQACITDGCPHREDNNVVCPSGFWGFRHIIEQPLSTVEATGSTTIPAGEAPDTITVEAGQAVELLNGYSKSLSQAEEHLHELAALPLVHTTAEFDRTEIGRSLQRDDLDIVYFYCHGGNRRGKAWLGVGARPPEELYASNLKAWEVRWLTRHPLVFINGCDTIGMSPDDLLTFNEILVWSKAAGLMGSEITIPETLGRAAGQQFLQQFVAGSTVGEAVRRLRLELLAGFNPLGLAYTPYSLEKLHIERN
jgi:CHAT domain